VPRLYEIWRRVIETRIQRRTAKRRVKQGQARSYRL